VRKTSQNRPKSTPGTPGIAKTPKSNRDSHFPTSAAAMQSKPGRIDHFPRVGVRDRKLYPPPYKNRKSPQEPLTPPRNLSKSRKKQEKMKNPLRSPLPPPGNPIFIDRRCQKSIFSTPNRPGIACPEPKTHWKPIALLPKPGQTDPPWPLRAPSGAPQAPLRGGYPPSQAPQGPLTGPSGPPRGVN